MRCCLLPCSLLLVFELSQSTALAQKAALNESIQRREAATWEIALKIWEFAEPGYQETRSARLLADTLEQAGFVVKRGVADIPMSDSITRDEAVHINHAKPVTHAVPQTSPTTLSRQQCISVISESNLRPLTASCSLQ